jgi:hypothetical protein
MAAARKPLRRREFGSVRQLSSGRWQVRYWAPDGARRSAPETFANKNDAQTWLTLTKADIERHHWTEPESGAVNFQEYALQWVTEDGLAEATDELYRRLLRVHLLSTFGRLELDEITPQGVRSWRTERTTATVATTVAKSYRLLKAIMQTAVDDELICRNPCRIKGAGSEKADERPTATVQQVDALAEAMGPRWRLMVYLGAYCPMRPEDQAALRCLVCVLPKPVLMRTRTRAVMPYWSRAQTLEAASRANSGFMRANVHRTLKW